MYNQIMKSVIQKLKTLFPDTRIETGPIEEGEKECRFEVGISQVSEKCVNRQRYCCAIKIFVNYYSVDTEQSYQYRYHVLELLLNHLESISLENGTSIGSSSRNGIFENGNLKIQAEYQVYFLKNQEEKVSMEDMSLK